ncbi:hypothetical protein FEZ33_04705 [Ruoffia tabacinasalis]|uniref:Uncharacterized protein n=1 Tax=Ruoffia tabacinasalis TaxID=87458 RepID=A0A5R9DYB4_9LACT|nr:ABC transporter permease [Ruoffia tabacinasalis]TLQ41753.1 hypothetical protein FEZ33_04705 [Ruoffia tabacinasalis]
MKSISIEFLKIKRSNILSIIILTAIIIWVPPYFNAAESFEHIKLSNLTISPEDYFFLQGMMAVTWMLFPASLIVTTLMTSNIETTNKGILKMRTLPINIMKMNFNKLMVVITICIVQTLLLILIYYVVAYFVSNQQNYNFFADFKLVISSSILMILSSLPMLCFFWMINSVIKSKVVALGINVLSLVPSVIMINLDIWYLYPICYPYYLMAKQYEVLSNNFSIPEFKLMPWIIVAVTFTVLCILVSNYSLKNRKD